MASRSGTFNPYVASVGARAGVVAAAGVGGYDNAGAARTILVINLDTANTVYLGADNEVEPYSADVTDQYVLPPLGQVTLDGTWDVWAICSAGQSALVQIAPGGTQSAPSPQQIAQTLVGSTLATVIAQAIQSAGVPPIDNPAALLVIFPSVTIAAGATYTTAHLNVSRYVSWVATLFTMATASGTGTTPFCRVTFSWSIASDNYDPLIVHEWVIPTTPFQFTYNYRHGCQGPCFGDTLTISVFNYDSQPANLTIGLFGSYRARTRTLFRGRYQWNPDGTANETLGLGTDSILICRGGSIAAGASASYLIDLADGPATFQGQSGAPSGAGATTYEILPEPQSVIGGAGQAEYLFTASVGAPTLAEGIILPRRVCTLKITNHDAAAHTIQALVVANNQPE